MTHRGEELGFRLLTGLGLGEISQLCIRVPQPGQYPRLFTVKGENLP